MIHRLAVIFSLIRLGSKGALIHIYTYGNPISYADPLGLFNLRIDGMLLGHFLYGDGETVDLSEYCELYLNDPSIIQYQEYIRMENYIHARNIGNTLTNSSRIAVSHRGMQTNYVNSIYSLGMGYDRYISNMIVNKDAEGSITYSGATWIFRYDEFKDPLDLHQGWKIGKTPFDRLPNLGRKNFDMMIHCQCLINQ